MQTKPRPETLAYIFQIVKKKVTEHLAINNVTEHLDHLETSIYNEIKRTFPLVIEFDDETKKYIDDFMKNKLSEHKY